MKMTVRPAQAEIVGRRTSQSGHADQQIVEFVEAVDVGPMRIVKVSIA